MDGISKPPEIGKAIKAERINKNISLTELAERSGVSKGMLSQIENGTANPTIATAWKITNALGFSLHELLGGEGRTDELQVMRRDESYVFEEDNGAWKIHVLSTPRMAEVLELYWVEIKKGAAMDSEPHVSGTVEFATIIDGEVEIASGTKTKILEKGDTAHYRADTEHSIKNLSKGTAEVYLVVKFE